MESEKFCIVLTTVNNHQNADQIIESLLRHQLAACIQTIPINSHYVWEGAVCRDDEILMVIKTRCACYEALEREVLAVHEYEVPQIVQVPIIEGFNPYLSWLQANTQV